MSPTAIRTLRSPVVKSLLPRRLPVCPPSRSFATTTRADMSGNPNDRSKPAGSHGANYHTECTGAALETVHKHSTPVQTDDGLTLFGANFCPFVQRTWIVLEAIGAEYTYKEVDPYKKGKDLLAINPKGLVPSLKIGPGDEPGQVQGLSESTVINEYILDRFASSSTATKSDGGVQVLPSDAYHRALARLAVFRSNQSLIPSFYRFLQSQPSSDPEHQSKRKEYLAAIADFEAGLDEQGPFWGGSRMSLPDINAFPWLFRTTNVMKHFRELPLDEWAPQGSKMKRWLDAMLQTEAVAATCSTEELYLDS